MIIIDTQIWLWWAFKPQMFSKAQQQAIEAHYDRTIGVCSVSCWEVATLANLNRIDLGVPTREWLQDAVRFPGVSLLSLTPEIAASCVEVFDQSHKDPIDRIIAATAVELDCPLLTSDHKILDNPKVQTIG